MSEQDQNRKLCPLSAKRYFFFQKSMTALVLTPTYVTLFFGVTMTTVSLVPRLTAHTAIDRKLGGAWEQG